MTRGAVILLGLLVGCASYGNQKIQDEETLAKIHEGQTTKAEVQELLGKPAAVDFTDTGLEKWVYTYAKASASGEQFIPIAGMFAQPDMETHTLTIVFTDEDVVWRFGKGETRN